MKSMGSRVTVEGNYTKIEMEHPTPGEWKAKIRECLNYVLKHLDVSYDQFVDGRIRSANEARERMAVIVRESTPHFMGEVDMADLLGIPRSTMYYSIRNWKRKHGEETPEDNG